MLSLSLCFCLRCGSGGGGGCSFCLSYAVFFLLPVFFAVAEFARINIFMEASASSGRKELDGFSPEKEGNKRRRKGRGKREEEEAIFIPAGL